MIYYMIRHKATGEFMPQLRRAGYTHWNPSDPNSINSLHVKATGAPRLLPSIRMAKACIAQWNCLPNAFQSYTRGDFEGNDEPSIDIKPDGRKKEDLEIVIVNIEETGVIK